MKFEQFEVGARFHTAPYLMQLEEILQFASTYDPHYYHTDIEKAEKSLFGSIVASGMHTVVVSNREWVRLGLLEEDMLGGLGIDVRWTAPVFPGDRIRSEVEVLEKRERDETSGVVTFGFTGFNQNDEVWAKVKIKVVVAREQAAVLSERA
ncbi:MAG TPA: MaoC/PaaZ C-terminal domain-containing protein [Noviherbaspirillum sp.]